VHARFSAQDVRDMRGAHPGVVVLAHPECPPEVVAESDFTGSTKAMSDYVSDNSPISMSACAMKPMKSSSQNPSANAPTKR